VFFRDVANFMLTYVVPKDQSRPEAYVYVPYLCQFLKCRVVSTWPNAQAGGQPRVGCPRLLIQYISSCSLYGRPFLHPQPENAPCRANRDPFIKELYAVVGL
jgi:hypothetical protein